MSARLPILAAILALTAMGLAATAASAQPAAKDAATAPPAGRTAKGTGVVTGIDPIAGTLTLKHQPIPALGWPSMTMDFKAEPASLLSGLKVGQKIAFDVNEGAGVPLITAIRKP